MDPEGRWAEYWAWANDQDAVVEILDALADDRFLVAFIRLALERDGSQTQLLIANAWRFDDGKFVEIWWLPEDVEKWDAFAG